MRRIPFVVSSFASLLLLCAAASPVIAQEARLFQNSWFWGLHAGSTNVGTTYASGSGASTLGGEWVITRQRGGLYVAYDQARFTRTAGIADPGTSSGTRAVTIHNMRTGSIAGLVFPFNMTKFRPYGGLGLSLNVLGDATPQPDIPTTAG